MLVVYLQKTKKELKSLSKLEIQIELDKACFQLDMAYGKTKYLVKIIQSDKVLKSKACKIASDPFYDGLEV